MADRPPVRPRLVIFDLDGVVYRGSQVVPGAPRLISELHERGILVRFATNNSMASRDQYVERLAGLGIEAAAGEIVTSTSATIGHLVRHLPNVRSVLAAGSSGMAAELVAAGFEVATAGEMATPGYQGEPLPRRFDAVVVGLDQRYDYGRVAVAATAIREGALFIATNADLRYPTPVGSLPGAGSLVAAIGAAAGGVEPLVIGKPGTAMFEEILEQANVGAEAAMVVGDNPDADIVAARRAGIFAVLLLTGVTDAATAAALDGDRRADAVVAGPDELRTCFDDWLNPPR
jgi:phosphoglycolate/pyridoxal phosphate phosphatase family enzyme